MNNDLFDFRPHTKEMAIAILVCVAVLVAVFCIGYGIGLRNAGRSDAGSVPDNGVRIDDVREQLGTAQVHQREITDGLAGAVERSDTAAERAGRIEERAVKSEAAFNDAGVIIDECQQIIGNIRNRGKTGTTSH